MSESRLQKAVETVIAAGYQMDSEAFEFLSTVANSDDPSEIISRALKSVNALEEKPNFIGRSFLEDVMQNPQIGQIGYNQNVHPQVLETEQIEQLDKESSFCESSGAGAYAKYVDPQIKVVEDCTEKLSSNGTMEEFQQYFQDRFKRVEKLLRQRMDVRAATPISEALKSSARTKLKIIGMVTEKRDAKKQLLVTIEDLNASATILVPTKASEEVQKKAQLILLDQIICAAVVKTSRAIIFSRRYHFSGSGS